jgi:hypothetical protein
MWLTARMIEVSPTRAKKGINFCIVFDVSEYDGFNQDLDEAI